MASNKRDEACEGMVDNCWYDHCIETENMNNGMIGNDIPECNPDGTYEPLQCNPSLSPEQSCWCVVANGDHVDEAYYSSVYNVDITGDINLDNSVDVTDIISIVQQILGSPVDQPPCLADVNSDYTVNILDIMEVVNVILAENDEPNMCENQPQGYSFYPDDENWCNTCTCDDDGNAMCTLILCPYDCTVGSADNATCGPEAWCRPEPPDSDQADDSDGTCTRYQAAGEYCGGLAPSYLQEACLPDDLACIDQNPSMMDEPGMCMQPCTTDSECVSGQCAVYAQYNDGSSGSFCMLGCENDQACGPYNTCMPDNLCHPVCSYGIDNIEQCPGNMVCNDLTPNDNTDSAGYCEPNACTNDDGCSSPDTSFCYNQEGCMSDNDIGECIVPTENCTEQYDPVCGCDGQVYSNGCYAHRDGVNIDLDLEYDQTLNKCCSLNEQIAGCPDPTEYDFF